MAIQILLIVLSGLLVLGGVVLAVINLPGAWLIFLGYGVSIFASGQEKIGWGVLIFVFCVACFSSVLDNVMSLAVARKYGATKWGLVGSFIGSIVGLVFFNVIGMLVGLFIGACAVEMIILKRALKDSAKSGLAAVIGWFLGAILKTFIAVGLALLWVILMV